MTMLSIALATYGLSWLLVNASGPGDIIGKLRDLMGVRYTEQGERYAVRWTGDLFNCIICLSVWVGVLMAILAYISPWLTYPMAAVGAAVLITEVVK